MGELLLVELVTADRGSVFVRSTCLFAVSGETRGTLVEVIIPFDPSGQLWSVDHFGRVHRVSETRELSAETIGVDVTGACAGARWRSVRFQKVDVAEAHGAVAQLVDDSGKALNPSRHQWGFFVKNAPQAIASARCEVVPYLQGSLRGINHHFAARRNANSKVNNTSRSVVAEGVHDCERRNVIGIGRRQEGEVCCVLIRASIGRAEGNKKKYREEEADSPSHELPAAPCVSACRAIEFNLLRNSASPAYSGISGNTVSKTITYLGLNVLMTCLVV